MIKSILLIISLCSIVAGFSQVTPPFLKSNEKPGIIYDTRQRPFKRTTFRLNGEELYSRQLRKILLNNERSAPLFKKGSTLHSVGFPVAIGGLGLFFAGLSKAYDLSSSATNSQKTNVYIFSGAGLVLNIIGDIQLFKGSKYKRNAINAFNQISLIDKPANLKDTIKKQPVINSNPRYLNSIQYYLDGKNVTVKTIDKLLSKSEKLNPYYLPMQKNKKLRNISAIAAVAFLSYPFVFHGNELNRPIAELNNPGLAWASLAGLTVSLTTAGIADRNVKQYRYNAYRFFNDEFPYPFNRRQERIINGISKIKMGWGNYGYGFLVKL